VKFNQKYFTEEERRKKRVESQLKYASKNMDKILEYQRNRYARLAKKRLETDKSYKPYGKIKQKLNITQCE